MKTQSDSSVAPLRDSEWVFRESTVPTWQVRFCVNYEYARESEEFKQRVEQIRARKPRPAGSPFDVVLMEFLGPEVWVLNTVLARKVPEFPATPWLEIPEERRSQLLLKIGITKHTGGYGYGFIDRGHPDAYLEALGKQTVGCIDDNASFVLEFNFKEHDAFIVKGFAAWLKSTRATLLALDNSKNSPYRATKARKGKRLNLSLYWQALKDLGFFLRQRAGGPSLESDTQDPKVAEEMIGRTKKVIAHFSAWGTTQKPGFVESWLEAPPV